MSKSTSILLLSGLLVFSLIGSIGFTDVEDIIEAQKQAKQLQSESGDKKILRGTEQGIKLGQEEFLLTCAVCHGKGAKGDGLFSDQLKKKPTDLTIIRKNNGGVFPALEVYAYIDGREGEYAHGPRSMPIWGMRYSAESWFDVSTQHAETVARGKIFELILYLNSIQED